MPQDGHRVNVINARELYVLVRTVMDGQTVSHHDVQQSDYAHAWAQGAQAAAPAAAAAGTGALEAPTQPLREALRPIMAWLRALKRRLKPYRRPLQSGLDGHNPGLTRIKVSALLSG